jgi:hypothetical protein
VRHRNSGKDKRRIRSIATWSLVMLVGFASIGGYVLLSITLNGPAPQWQSSGTAFIVQPKSEPDVDKVTFVLQAFIGGSNPSVTYRIYACGPRPYSGDLVLTGSAQIVSSKSFVVRGPPQQIQQFSGGEIAYFTDNSYESNYIDGGQLIRFNLPQAPCSEPVSGLVVGSMLGPLQESWPGPWGLWHGPHASQSWPQVGLSSGPGGSVTLPNIAGEWVLPRSLGIDLSQEFDTGWSVDSSVPSTSSPATLSWSGTNEIIPSAQLTDTASVALLQDWIVVCAIAFGFGGSMLASLLFEWIRPREPECKTSDQPGLGDSGTPISSQQPHRMKHRIAARLVVLGFAFILGYARRRRRQES